MSNKFIDLTGQTFGGWTVIKKSTPNSRSHTRFKVQCVCGKTQIVLSWDLRQGRTKSCGDPNCETAHQIASQACSTHGLKNTKEYIAWKNMKSRCLNPNNRDYPNYGGRGILIYSDWVNNFQAFYDYLQTLIETREMFEIRTGLSDIEVTLDRIDTNKGYEPDNLKWSSRAEQVQNQNRTVLNEYIVRFIKENHNQSTTSEIQDGIIEEFGILINYNTIENVRYANAWSNII